jgi:hypothetical protein
MSDLAARVRDDRTGHEGTIIELDNNYRARVRWDGIDGLAWVPRRNLIILTPAADICGNCGATRAVATMVIGDQKMLLPYCRCTPLHDEGVSAL